MSLKELNLVFRCSRVLALTPSKIEPTQILFPSRIYAFLWIVLLTTAVSISATYKHSYYKTYTSIQLMVQISIDTFLFVVNISTIVSVQKKKQQWIKLINCLKATNEKQEIKKRFWFLPFLLTNATYISIQSYNIFTWTSILGLEFVKGYAVEIFQFYAHFIVYFLIYAILNMLLQRYKDVYSNLSELLNVQNRDYNFFVLKKIEHYVCILDDCVDIFNDIFGWLILEIIALTFFELLLFFHELIKEYEESSEMILSTVLFFSWHLVNKKIL